MIRSKPTRFPRVLSAVVASMVVVVAAQAADYDFDGDGRADFAVYDRATGMWAIQQSGGMNRTILWGARGEVPVAADYDGDGRSDLATYNRAAGVFTVLRSSTSETLRVNWGWRATTPVPADYDGDGLDDIAVYHQASGTWYIRKSSGGMTITRYGGRGMRPIPADYDGDGRADLAVYESSTANWYVRKSGGGTLSDWLGGPVGQPMPADYDGDGKADVAVYVPVNGTWYIHYSGGGDLILPWGWIETGAVPADYDGDGLADITVFHAAAGDWYPRLSGGGGTPVINWGLGSRAVPGFRHGAREGLVVLAFGDSITYGNGSRSEGPSTAYPKYLEEWLEGAYGGDITNVNRGVPGEFTYQGRDRLPAVLDQVNPDVLLLMEGTNDHQLRKGFSEIESNLGLMVATAVSRGIHVVLATIPPVVSVPGRDRTDQMSRITAFNPRIGVIAAAYNIEVARVFEAITAVPNWENTLMEHVSGNHPNDAGYGYVRGAFFDPPLVDGLNAGKSY